MRAARGVRGMGGVSRMIGTGSKELVMITMTGAFHLPKEESVVVVVALVVVFALALVVAVALRLHHR